MSHLARVLATAARLSKADGHRYALAFYIDEAKRCLESTVEA